MALTEFIGQGGRLLVGSRTVTEFDGWRARALPEGGYRVTVAKHRPDPYWWDAANPATLEVEFEIGRAFMVGTARIESREPLIIIMELAPNADD